MKLNLLKEFVKQLKSLIQAEGPEDLGGKL
jgi:hypothetical protein